MTPELRSELEDLLRSGRRILAIKRFREATGADLRTAKEAVESLDVTAAPRPTEPPAPVVTPDSRLRTRRRFWQPPLTPAEERFGDLVRASDDAAAQAVRESGGNFSAHVRVAAMRARCDPALAIHAFQPELPRRVAASPTTWNECRRRVVDALALEPWVWADPGVDASFRPAARRAAEELLDRFEALGHWRSVHDCDDSALPEPGVFWSFAFVAHDPEARLFVLLRGWASD